MTNSASASRGAFLDALDKLHERFLVDVPGVTEVWLVRHGDAYDELMSDDDAGVAPGRRIDPPLSPRGREQAGRLGRRLARSTVAGLYASNLQRAQETARLAAAQFREPPGVFSDPRLREVKTRWDDGAVVDEPEDEPARYIPFVEPFEEVVARMQSAVNDIAATAGPGRRVALVSHAGAITMYLSHVLGLDFGHLRMLLGFTSVSVVRIKDGMVVVGSIGDTGHLLSEA